MLQKKLDYLFSLSSFYLKIEAICHMCPQLPPPTCQIFVSSFISPLLSPKWGCCPLSKSIPSTASRLNSFSSAPGLHSLAKKHCPVALFKCTLYKKPYGNSSKITDFGEYLPPLKIWSAPCTQPGAWGPLGFPLCHCCQGSPRCPRSSSPTAPRPVRHSPATPHSSVLSGVFDSFLPLILAHFKHFQGIYRI